MKGAIAAAALAATLMATAGPAGAADGVRLLYRVHVGGIAVLDAAADVSVAPGRYSVSVQAETEGLIGRFAAWRSRSSASGALAGAGPAPDSFRASSLWRGEPRSVRIDYGPGGALTAVADPPADGVERDPVPPDLQQGTLDPLSAVVAAMIGVRQEGTCGRSLPVFDGRHRYDLSFAPLGGRRLERSRYSVFAGDALHCRASYRSIAGQWKNRGSGWFRPGGGAAERPPVDVYIAPVRDGVPPVPVRVETDSPFGSVVAHLVEVAALPAPPAAADGGGP